MAVQAYGEAGDLLDRAIELFDHVPRRRGAGAGSTASSCCSRAGVARYYEGDLPRSVALLREGARARGRDAEPRRAAACYGWLERSLTHSGHADEGEEALAHALALLPADERQPRAGVADRRTAPRR